MPYRTLALPTSSRLAISVGPRPALARTLISLVLAFAVGARPRYLPWALALAIPSRCRSNIISGSNCATLPSTFNFCKGGLSGGSPFLLGVGAVV